MAQRTIHYLFGEIFSGQIEFRDKKRFLLGSVMPDAYVDVKDRNITHFKVKTESRIYFDFNSFREQFSECIFKDDLYLGYYMHLVEDSFYRQFIYSGRFSMPVCREDVAELHNDYHILNSHIVKKYGLTNLLTEPVCIDNEQIVRVAEFRINDFLADMSDDFTEQTSGQTRFINEAMVDEFIEEYASEGLRELQAISEGRFLLQAEDYAYPPQYIHRSE